MAVPAGVEATPAGVSRTLNSASLLLIVLRNLLDIPAGDLPEDLRIAAGEVVRQTERLVLDAQEEADTLERRPGPDRQRRGENLAGRA